MGTILNDLEKEDGGKFFKVNLNDGRVVKVFLKEVSIRESQKLIESHLEGDDYVFLKNIINPEKTKLNSEGFFKDIKDVKEYIIDNISIKQADYLIDQGIEINSYTLNEYTKKKMQKKAQILSLTIKKAHEMAKEDPETMKAMEGMKELFQI